MAMKRVVDGRIGGFYKELVEMVMRMMVVVVI